MSRSPASSPVFFYSPRIPRKHQPHRQQQQQLLLHEDQMQSNFLFDNNSSRHLNQQLQSHSLSTFSPARKSLVRKSPVDTLLNQFTYSPHHSDSDKIIVRGTNQSRTTPAAAAEQRKILLHDNDTANNLFPLQTNTTSTTTKTTKTSESGCRMPLLSSASGIRVPEPRTPPPVSLVCSSEMEQEIQSLNSVIDYINAELQALVNEDDSSEPAASDHVPQNEEVNQQRNAAGGDVTHVRKGGEILIHHHKDHQQQSEQIFHPSDPTPGSECRLTFCEKSLRDSADTVIDGCSSIKDMSSSADFSDENDVLSKTDLTTSEDELVDEGIQCNSADPRIIPFNHLTVLEMESFLRKYRTGDPQKDEGMDSILFFPDFVRDVMEFLVKHGIKKEGIFRRSGVKSRINLLMNSSFFTGSAGNNNNNSPDQSQESILEEACAYDVADFLKGWFRNQDPLLTAAVVSTLLPLITQSEDGQDLNALRAHLMLLPNRIALEALLRFLSKFADKSEYNSMTVSNLAIVWTPSICREGSQNIPMHGNNVLHSSSTSASILESVSSFMKDARTVLEFLLTNTDHVFSIARNELECLPRVSVPGSPSIPSILCRSSKIMSASPYEIFLKIVINRSSWDPLVVETVDDGETQRIRHSFSRFVPNSGSIRIKRRLSRPSPTDETIQIHEESVDEGRSYTCDWLITCSGSGASHSRCSEVSLSLYCDLRGRPLIWYKKSFPRLLETYLNSISSSFPGSKNDRSGDRVSDPFSCCFFMRQAVSA